MSKPASDVEAARVMAAEMRDYERCDIPDCKQCSREKETAALLTRMAARIEADAALIERCREALVTAKGECRDYWYDHPVIMEFESVLAAIAARGKETKG